MTHRGVTRYCNHMAKVTRLQVAVQQSGMPMYLVATAAGISPTLLSFYMNGHRLPSTDRLKKLAEILEVPVRDLMGTEEVDSAR